MNTKIDLQRDTLLPLGTALSKLPNRPSPPTLWRWRVKGVNGVRLQCVRCGGHWLTTARAVAEFLAAQTEACQPQTSQEQPQGRSDSLKRRLVEQGLLDCTLS